MSREQPVALAAIGMFVALAGLFVLTNAGRIDIIDGQVRYDVARNWLDTGRPQVTDRALLPTRYVVRGNGMAYSSYNGAASVTPMPLMLVSRLLPGHSVERDRFAFSMTSPVFGALAGGLLVIAYTMLGLGLRTAVSWTAVTSFTTLWWPGSLTVFDQNQHALFALLAMLLAWEGGRQRSLALAILGGLAGGVLITYQENYALLLPTIGLAVLASPVEGTSDKLTDWRAWFDRAAFLRYVAFGLSCGVGLLLFADFNYMRFGTLINEGRYDNALMFKAANPLAAALSLAVSPGKSVLLFSPPLLLAAVGARRFFARAPVLATAIGATSVVQILFITQISFFGGDWCWGPRYLLILLPLWALALPFGAAGLRRGLLAALVALGLGVQLMGVSVDYQRFFFEHNFPPFFWLDQWAYFKHSQFFSRPMEILSIARDGVPPEAHYFSPTPDWQITYTPSGPPDYARQGALWVRHFKVFHTLRPWAVWIASIDTERRPVNPLPLSVLCAVVLAAGLALVGAALRRASEPTVAIQDVSSEGQRQEVIDDS